MNYSYSMLLDAMDWVVISYVNISSLFLSYELSSPSLPIWPVYSIKLYNSLNRMIMLIVSGGSFFNRWCSYWWWLYLSAHPDVLCILYVVDMGELLYIMTLLGSSVVAVLCDSMLWVWWKWGAFVMHTMINYTEGLVIGHNTLHSDSSMSDICHSYSHLLTTVT